MASEHAYTPGLRVTPRTTVRKERRLPIAGRVLVEKGAKVSALDVVAHAELPGDVATINVVNLLGVSPSDLPGLMLKQPGEAVSRGETIAQTRPLIKWFRNAATSPMDGVIETVSRITGQVIVRTAPRPVDVRAYVDGTVVEVYPGEGVAVETMAALVQGILGIGGEVMGEITMVARDPAEIIAPAALTQEHAGKIVIAGSLVTREVFEQAARVGVAAVVCGGFHDADLRALLGYDLGVAITGHEDIRPTLIITEGFGQIPMARGTYDLLASHAGNRASANGATQIRAGVLRPEILVPLSQTAGSSQSADEPQSQGLTPGCTVRIIREPLFGQLGVVKSLPHEACRVESEAKVRVVELQMPDGQSVTVPRTNVEVIAS